MSDDMNHKFEEAAMISDLLCDFTTLERAFLLGYMSTKNPDLLFEAIERLRSLT
jgi:hypothetical protein